MTGFVYCAGVRIPTMHTVRRVVLPSVSSSFVPFWLDVLKGSVTPSPYHQITNQCQDEYMTFPGISYHGRYSEKTECVNPFVERFISLVENLPALVEFICVIGIEFVGLFQASQPNDVTMTNQYAGRRQA